MRAGLAADHWRVFLEGVRTFVDIGRGGCSATVELILTLGLVPSSDLIISRHLAGTARVLSLHYSTSTLTTDCLLRMPTIITMILQMHVPPCSGPNP